MAADSVAKFKTTAAYLSGCICGRLWMPDVMAGKTHRFDVRRCIDRFSDPRGVTFRDILLSELMENGGDFQDARFTADSEIRIERRRIDGAGRYTMHAKTIAVADLPDCDDLVNADAYTFLFLGDED